MSLTLIIDGNHLAHRAKYSFSLSNRGVDVSVTYGSLRVIQSWIRKFAPTTIVVCWDGGIPEYRRQALPEYKANRHKDDDPLVYEDFVRQLRELSDFALPIMGMVSVRIDGAEADDLMYHASRLITGKSIIATGDRDLLQAVSDKVSVFSPSHGAGDGVIFTPEDVFQTYGISVASFVDWKALQGDNSDNIPGVPGIGEKTATKLFKEFGSLTGITNAAMGRNPEGELSGRIGDNIKSFGFERLAKNIYVMALYADRVGARKAIIESVDNYHGVNKTLVKKYLMRNAFSSLMDGQFYSSLSRLVAPTLELKGVRVPIVANVKRQPVE